MTSFGVNIAIIESDRVLLTKRADFPVWCLPGGSIDGGETIAQAAIRETLEETGLEVRLVRLVGLYSRPHWEDGGSHAVLFAAEAQGGSLVKQTNETLDARFFSTSELPHDLLWWHQQRIKDAMSGERGFVRLQDVRWPFGNLSRSEAEAKVKTSEISNEDAIAGLCTIKPEESEALELSNSFDA